jgi:hypothetical protein
MHTIETVIFFCDDDHDDDDDDDNNNNNNKRHRLSHIQIMVSCLLFVGFLAALSASRKYSVGWLGDR